MFVSYSSVSAELMMISALDVNLTSQVLKVTASNNPVGSNTIE